MITFRVDEVDHYVVVLFVDLVYVYSRCIVVIVDEIHVSLAASAAT